MQIFIPGNVPSSKNSKVKCASGIFHSQAVRKYLQTIGIANYSVTKQTVADYKTRPNLFEQIVAPVREKIRASHPPLPLIVGLYFVRSTHRKFDWINISQIICDLLVAHKVIPDDSMDIFVPLPVMRGSRWYHVDKDKPGCVLRFGYRERGGDEEANVYLLQAGKGRDA